ncbi:MAG: MBL fold metallo-hydrolase [Phormidesmis sp.]
MKVTWFDANSWLVEADGWRVLIDPWLVGDLVFGNAPWLVKGFRPTAVEIPQNIDLILLSQGLADHAHPETLAALDKSIPVVASPDAAKVANEAGYDSVTVVTHEETTERTKAGAAPLTITALQGAVVGPMKRENGYILSVGSAQLYYEPHGYPDVEQMKALGPVDVVITPLADITLAGIAPVVRGGDVAVQIAKLLKPQVMMPTAEAGRANYSGLISSVLQTAGGAAEMRSRLQKEGLNTQILQPTSGETLSLDLRSSVAAS